jgi:hypothetical protein
MDTYKTVTPDSFACPSTDEGINDGEQSDLSGNENGEQSVRTRGEMCHTPNVG